MVDIVIDFLLESLSQILNSSHDVALEGKDAINSLHDDLRSINTFLIKNPQIILTLDLQHMVQHFQQSAYAMLDLMDSSAIIAINNKKQNPPTPTRKKHHVLRVFDPSHSNLLADFKQEVTSIKKAFMNTKFDALPLDSRTAPCASGYQIGGGSSEYDEDIYVGFEEQEATVKDRLAGELKKLQIISIVGMGGIGKTTLAKRLYGDPYIVHHFYVRGWTCVSQNYRKKDTLLSILESIVENEDKLQGVCEKKLAEKLYKRLKEKRYLIVVDDIWDVKAWWDLIRSFPDDNNGSRIMVTTRLASVAMEIAGKPEVPPHFMSFLSQDESWDLLQKRVFKESAECPLELVDLGQRIAERCNGLPLAVMIVGGILVKIESTREQWTEVYERLNSYITTGDAEQQLMAILGQSYDHLPSYLKPCFVYFGAFPEDEEIVVWRLILLWIAEGFVVETGDRSLTCVAEEYLRDLVGRSLVVIAKRSSRKGVKACRMHDMLRVFCLEKAKELKFKFGQQIGWYGPVASPETPPIIGQPLCFHSHGSHDGQPCFPHLRFTLSSPRSYIYKLIRVLNLWGVYLNIFPEEILQLFHLRFLETRVHHLDSLPSEISNLWNLEVLIIVKDNWGRVRMPRSFWSLVKLRHLSISDGIEFEPPSASHGCPPSLDSLQSVSALPASQSRMETKSIFRGIPNLKKVVFYRGPQEKKQIIIPSLAHLIQLVTFKLIDNRCEQPHLIIPRTTSFPQNLKKITLSGGHAEWKEMSKLGKLPNLEILKLRRNSFSGPLWETNDGEFSRLKYLKLSFMDLERWVCSESIHFPNLEQLVIERCDALLEIPSSVGAVFTLETIEVSWSSLSVSDSALKIQEEQQNDGNDGLKVLVSNPMGEDDLIGKLNFFKQDKRFSIHMSSGRTP